MVEGCRLAMPSADACSRLAMQPADACSRCDHAVGGTTRARSCSTSCRVICGRDRRREPSAPYLQRLATCSQGKAACSSIASGLQHSTASMPCKLASSLSSSNISDLDEGDLLAHEQRSGRGGQQPLVLNHHKAFARLLRLQDDINGWQGTLMGSASKRFVHGWAWQAESCT